jgi:hypothetical protein
MTTSDPKPGDHDDASKLDLDAIETELAQHLDDLATFARVAGADDPMLDVAGSTVRTLVAALRTEQSARQAPESPNLPTTERQS